MTSSIVRAVVLGVGLLFVGYLMMRGDIPSKLRWILIAALMLFAIRLYITAQRFRSERHRDDDSKTEEPEARRADGPDER